MGKPTCATVRLCPNNTSFDDSTKESRNYSTRHRNKIGDRAGDLSLCKQAIKIVKGEPLTLMDVWDCQREIQLSHSKYLIAELIEHSVEEVVKETPQKETGRIPADFSPERLLHDNII